MTHPMRGFRAAAAALPLLATPAFLVAPAEASSHREAPQIAEMPKVDGTDFYMFNSYEPGRSGFVTLVACYIPLQDPYGGPNYFLMNPAARYEIKIDNNGDAREDLTFRFQFSNTLRDLTVPVGGVDVPVPLINIGPIAAGQTGALNVAESFTCSLVRNNQSAPLTNAANGSATFAKPVDNIGNKSIPDYAAYAGAHVYNVNIPGCPTPGRLFVGQRKDPFVVNLGEAFDLINLNPIGAPDSESDDLADKNVTAFILEVPTSCLTSGPESVIGAWTTSSLPKQQTFSGIPTFAHPVSYDGKHVQVSRLGNPLVNELVIGLRDKNRFNNSEPSADGQFLTYVTNPTLPVLLNVLFGVTPPCLPRNDLVAVFLTGVPGLNQPGGVTPGEMLRLNTNTNAGGGGFAITPRGSQSTLGVLGGDLQGYPNGRRPGDDVVDIALRAVMGVLSPDAGDAGGCAPHGLLPYTDGAAISDMMFDNAFPYLTTPIPGSPR